VRDLRLLLAAGLEGDVNSREPVYENTPLHWAASYGEVGMVRELLEAKADVHARNKVACCGHRRHSRRGYVHH
jgi:ankyrin repeat protein